jgi:hypothetical protein
MTGRDRGALLAHRLRDVPPEGRQPSCHCPAPVGGGAQSGNTKGCTIMSVSDAPSCACGGENLQAARTDRFGEGEEAILYLHYWLKCSRCGCETEDTRMRYLNAAGAAGARVRHG